MTFEEFWGQSELDEMQFKETVARAAWDHQQSVIDGLQTEIDECTATVKRLTVDANSLKSASDVFGGKGEG